MEGILGPLHTSVKYISQDFSHGNVTEYDSRSGAILGDCIGRQATTIIDAIKANALNGNLDDDILNKKENISSSKEKVYVAFCIPCYNETFDNLIKTILSIMENIDFMKHNARFYDDESGIKMKTFFNEFEPVIVPIFDGTYKGQMDDSIRDWLSGDMPGSLDTFPEPNSEKPKTSNNLRDADLTQVDVRVVYQKWWYYCLDNRKHREVERKERLYSSDSFRNNGEGGTIPLMNLHDSPNSEPYIGASHLHFHLVPIIKRVNHRKHNSHHWFFEGICVDLDPELVFLTDCSTRFNISCLAKLTYGLMMKSDLIGVTARQRVELPNPSYFPCQQTKIPFLMEDKNNPHEFGSQPCWKCKIAYYCSPALLQGFEFEATLIMNSALFNLVEAMPVLPGPCQLLKWRGLRKHEVVEEYFDLLFSEADVETGVTRHHTRAIRGPYLESNVILKSKPQRGNTKMSSNPLHDSSEALRMCEEGETSITNNPHKSMRITMSSAIPPHLDDKVQDATLKLTEFLRLHLRLAEDRILSFATVFCSGYGTKWIPGATFYYEPEVTFDMLLKQRRRWINGTAASFLYFFTSKRAELRTSGGFFDSHKAGKSSRIVQALWSLSIVQFLFVLVSPSVFAIALYNALLDVNSMSGNTLLDVPDGYMSRDVHLSYAGGITTLYLLSYAVWTLRAYFIHPHELFSIFMCLVGSGVIGVIWWAILKSAIEDFGVVHYLVLFSLLSPVAIALTQSVTSALLYLRYLPYFMIMSVFFLVYLPSYSLARLWDTSWGNRNTGQDQALNKRKEEIMFRNVLKFNVFLVSINLAVSLGCCIYLTPMAQLMIMCVLFAPAFIQITGALLFFLVVSPVSNALTTREKKEE